MHASPLRITNVLLIDDDIDDFHMFEEVIKNIDPTIRVSFISKVDDLPKDGGCSIPDLLFLDINMPDRNGFEWLTAIRSKGLRLPVIMYSTASNPDYVQQAYRQGANMYFPKPDSYKELQESLSRILNFDWIDPGKVTANFYRNGYYTTFHL